MYINSYKNTYIYIYVYIFAALNEGAIEVL